MDRFTHTNRTRFKNQVLNSLLNAGLLEMTIPDKPTSSKQKYRLTETGVSVIEKASGEE
jgi:ATP-dependent DNA helicase RecG